MSSSRDHRKQLYEQLVGNEVADGKYVITRLLGFGGMGAVYEAVQKNMDRKVALKLIPTHDPTIVARFEREALTISKLKHPNTVTVFDFGQTKEGFLFLSMELLAGKTLSDAIEDGPLSADRAVHIASQICRSLGEAHRAGIVHRDVKPDNIILITVDNDEDFVKVLDFGIAKAVLGEDDVQLTGDGRIIGTPRYMSPEQILAEPLDHRSDIYSLGCILFEMLCGAPPFQQSSTTALMISHTQDPPPPFAQRLDSGAMSAVPHRLEQVVRRALAKAPNDRQQETDELRVELEEALDSLGSPVDASRSGEVDSDATAAALPSHRAGGATNEPSGMPARTEPPAGPEVDTATPRPTTSSSGAKPVIIGIVALLVVIGGLIMVKSMKSDDATGGAEDGTAIAQPTDPDGDNTEAPPKTTDGVGEAKDEKTASISDNGDNANDAKPGIVNVEIQSEPAGARVFDGDTLIGNTPTPMPVPADAGRVVLRLEKSGFHNQRIYVTVDPEKQNQTAKFKLTPVAKKRPDRPARAARKQKKRRQKRAEPTPASDSDDSSEGDDKPNIELLEDEPKPKVEMLD